MFYNAMKQVCLIIGLSNDVYLFIFYHYLFKKIWEIETVLIGPKYPSRVQSKTAKNIKKHYFSHEIYGK